MQSPSPSLIPRARTLPPINGSTPVSTSPVPEQVLPSPGELVPGRPRDFVVDSPYFICFLPCNCS